MTDLTSGDTSSKSDWPAKDFESCETVSIAESAQCSLVRRPAQLLACHAIAFGDGGSRGEFGFRAGRSAESPRVCFGGKRENPCRL